MGLRYMEPKKKKILILSMTAGFGHVRAGEALLDYAKEHLPEASAQHVDVLDIDPTLRKYSLKMYGLVSKKLPLLWGMFYESGLLFFVVKKFMSIRAAFNDSIPAYVRQKNPDAVICTNIFILHLLGRSGRALFKNIPLGVVVTDYHGHSFYRVDWIHYYFVATASVGQELEAIGIPKEKIVVTGIPINPKFYVKENIGELKAKYGVQNHLPVVVLIASFSISGRQLQGLVEKLLGLDPPIYLIAITSGNQKCYDMLKNNVGGHERFLLVNWTNEIEEYIKIADVVISKAGGLTVSECLALQTPMIIFNPIPGQEEHNVEFLEKNNFGKQAADVDRIINLVPGMIAKAHSSPLPLFEVTNPCEKIFSVLI